MKMHCLYAIWLALLLGLASCGRKESRAVVFEQRFCEIQEAYYNELPVTLFEEDYKFDGVLSKRLLGFELRSDGTVELPADSFYIHARWSVVNDSLLTFKLDTAFYQTQFEPEALEAFPSKRKSVVKEFIIQRKERDFKAFSEEFQKKQESRKTSGFKKQSREFFALDSEQQSHFDSVLLADSLKQVELLHVQELLFQKLGEAMQMYNAPFRYSFINSGTSFGRKVEFRSPTTTIVCLFI